mmetsp:Transcript_14720/g.33304  ORF Transcript_14720/g.33304 Transcript_14720/m.33304 type:complete len:267 (+) Transcript_14720:611-1411(+)
MLEAEAQLVAAQTSFRQNPLSAVVALNARVRICARRGLEGRHRVRLDRSRRNDVVERLHADFCEHRKEASRHVVILPDLHHGRHERLGRIRGQQGAQPRQVVQKLVLHGGVVLEQLHRPLQTARDRCPSTLGHLDLVEALVILQQIDGLVRIWHQLGHRRAHLRLDPREVGIFHSPTHLKVQQTHGLNTFQLLHGALADLGREKGGARISLDQFEVRLCVPLELLQAALMALVVELGAVVVLPHSVERRQGPLQVPRLRGLQRRRL